MSRIAGIFNYTSSPQPTVLLDTMVAALRCHYPWVSKAVTAGKAACSWVGWAHAANAAASHGVITVMDGHFFNRAEFGEADSDAGLLIALYRRHGFEAALAHLNGDFAAVLYDAALDTLWVARDRFGVKPLYYLTTPQYFAFASQPRALLALPGLSGEVNRSFVARFAGSHYRYFDNNPEQSPYKEISQLPAARFLKVTGSCVKPQTYWFLKDLPDFTASEDALAEQYREVLADAVTLRFKAARRPAFTLSGGMDSSSVLGFAVRAANARQTAFSTVYVDKTYDESADIQSILGTSVARWCPVEIGVPDIFPLVAEMIEVHDEPVATATWLSHFLLARTASAEGFASLFGGLGGDELNAGEYEYFFFHFADLRAAGDEVSLSREVDLWVHYHDHPIFRKSPEAMENGLARLVDLHQPGRCLPDRRRLQRYYAALNRDYFDLQEFEPVMDHVFTSYLKNRTFQDITRETLPCCLRAEDRQTTAFGLDHFLPFLDHRLVEFMFRVSGKLKIRAGVTKYLLRQAMHGVLPEATRTRIKKTGWNAPAHVWFSGRGRSHLLDLVHSRSFRDHGVYNLPKVLNIIDQHEAIISAGRCEENHMMFLWQLVNMELWLAALDRRERSKAAG